MFENKVIYFGITHGKDEITMDILKFELNKN